MSCIMRRCVAMFFALLMCCTGLRAAAAQEINLAVNGNTDYVIVKPSQATPVDDYAVENLADYLKQITGAEFTVVDPDKVSDAKPAIFVGISPVVKKKLGVADPLADLEDQEHVSRPVGPNIFLYGKGVHGNLSAVMEFLENSLGWRWYTVHRDPVCPHKPTVRLAPFERKRNFSFLIREVPVRINANFFYQNGTNMGYERKRVVPVYPSYLRCDEFVHTSFAYIPPAPNGKYANRFQWMTKKDYFETNPEYFSLWTNGKRVPDRQLCFSNPGLRKELTRNILKHIEVSPDNDIITVDAADTPGPFCYCPDCQALEKKYGSPGGPLYDYILEICDLLRKEHPDKFVKILAYRSSQTQKPPVLPEGTRLPENLLVYFAPIEDNAFGDWSHPDPEIQETYGDLVAWSRISDHLSAWIYPNPWGTGIDMPVGNVQRIVTNMRLMHKTGCSGIFVDQQGFNERSGFSELQAYLIMRLAKDVNCDADAVIEEFTDYLYGAAGPAFRQYLKELEEGRLAMKTLPLGVSYKSRNYDDRTFPYLTVENIHRWQGYFDRMVEETANDPEAQGSVRLARRELDIAALWKWFGLQKKYPKSYTDYTVVVTRITDANERKSMPKDRALPMRLSAVSDFVDMIKAGGKQKPLPAKFDGIDESRIKVFLPRRYRGGVRTVVDPDAAMGYSVPVDDPRGLPFAFGFHQWKPESKRIKSLKVEAGDITPGKYRLYTIGEIPVTEDCVIYFGKSWQTHLRVGDRLYEPGEENLWDAYVSMKFQGPTYGGKGGADEVLVDRIILVSKDNQ